MNTTTIHISDILNSQRIDVAYYKDNIRGNIFVPLSKYVDIKGGKRIPKGKSFSSENTDYLYLRLSDIEDFECIDYSALKNISEELFNILQRYEIKNDQIVFSIAGTIGRVFVIKNIPKGKRIILTENCAKLLPKNDAILPDYVALLLNCNFVQKQIEQSRIQTTIPKIGLDRIAKLKVPKVPPIDVQQKIVEIYSKAQQARLKKIQEAKRLLDGVEDYLLDVLKIDKNRQKGKKTMQINKSFSSIIGNRLDVSFHKGIEDAVMLFKDTSHKTLGEISSFSTEGWDQKSVFDDTFPYIGISAIDTSLGEIISIESVPVNNAPSRAKKIVRKNDILISTTRPNRGAICVYEGDDISIASTGFSIIREIKDYVLKDYIYLVLRSSISLKQMELRSSGGNYPAIIESELKQILIPIPSLCVQQKIVDKVYEMKEQAKHLQHEGDALLEEAKQRIEKTIIG